MLYWAMFNDTVPAEVPLFAALARTEEPETIWATSPAGTLATVTAGLVVA
jgi:hypothetical protein